MNPLASESEQVLVLLPAEPDRRLCQLVFEQARLTAQPCADVAKLCQGIAAGASAALVAGEALGNGAVRELIRALGQQPDWSDFPLIILMESVGPAPGPGLRMLGLLEPLGNIIVIERPVPAATLASAMQAALRARRRQLQVRDLLAEQARGQQQRERFLTRLAHELRDPLSVVRHSTMVLGRLNAAEPAAAEQRFQIVRQTDRLARLIDDMLDVYQALAGRLRLAREAIDLRDVARNSLGQVAVEASSQGVRLASQIPGEPLPMESDPARLAQIFTHLLGNAVRHTPAGGQVELRLDRDGSSAVGTVRDTGEGIPTELLPRLFEQFAEAGDDSSSGPGLRLGLTLVQRLVQLHGGTVTAASDGLGQGSTFAVRLPLRSDALAPTTSTAPAAPPRQGRPLRVLVVEDNPDGRRALQMMLQLWGHEVTTAGDGAQAVQQALADPPDVALLDIGLPGLNGYEVARELRARLGDRIVLAAMTGYGQPHDRRHALEAGFDAHFVKPVPLDALQEFLARGPGGAPVPV